MTSQIFIDANIPIYVAGTDHPLREPCTRVMELVAELPHLFLTDAEVMQELLHRYVSIRRWDLGRIALTGFSTAMSGRIEAMLSSDVDAAALLADKHVRLSARDLIHATIMRRLNCERIVSTDGDFDGIEGIERLDPMRVDEWRDSVTA